MSEYRNDYFAFSDGAFQYDCIDCGGKCCRGKGIGVDVESVPGLLKLYPPLSAFVGPSFHDNVFVDFSNYSPRCFFLNDEGLCRIEQMHGRSNKPAVCKIFPFGHLRLFGETLVVAPQFECPMVVSSASERSPLSHHATLRELIGRYELGRPAGGVPRIGAASFESARLELEVQLRDLAEPYIYAGEVSDLWPKMFAFTMSQTASAKPRFQSLWASWQELLDVGAPTALPRHTQALLAAMAPGLRIHHYLDWGPLDAPVYLAALEFYCGLALAVDEIRLNAPSIKQLADYAEPAFAVMVHLLDPVRPTQSDVLAALAEQCQGPLQEVLLGIKHTDGSRLLKELMAPAEAFRGLARLEFVRTVGQVLAMTVTYA